MADASSQRSRNHPVTRLLTSQPLFFLLPLEVAESTPEFFSDRFVNARVIPRPVDLAIGTPGTAILQHAHDQLKSQRDASGGRAHDSDAMHPFGAVLLAMARKVDSPNPGPIVAAQPAHPLKSNSHSNQLQDQLKPTLAYGIVRLESHGRTAVPEYDTMSMTDRDRSSLTVMGCKLKVRPGDEISRPVWMNLVKSPPWRARIRYCRAALQMSPADIERRLQELGHYTQSMTLHLFEDRIDQNGRPSKKAPTKQPNLPPCWMPETLRFVNNYLNTHVLPALRRWFACRNRSPERSQQPKFTLAIFGRDSTRFWNTELSQAERESVYRVTKAVSNYINWQYRRTCTAQAPSSVGSDPMARIVQKFLDDYTVQHYDSSIDGYTAQELHPAMNALLQCVTVPGTFSRPYTQMAQIMREACRVRSSPNVSGVDVLLSSPLELSCTVPAAFSTSWPIPMNTCEATTTTMLHAVGSLPLLHWISGLLVKAMIDSILASELLRQFNQKPDRVRDWRDVVAFLVQNEVMPVDFTQMRLDLQRACEMVANVLEQAGKEYTYNAHAPAASGSASGPESRWQQRYEYWKLVERMFTDITWRTRTSLRPEHVGGFEHNWLLIAQCLLKFARFLIKAHVGSLQSWPTAVDGCTWTSIARQTNARWFTKDSVLQHFVADVFEQLKTARNLILNRFIQQHSRTPTEYVDDFSDLPLATLGQSVSTNDIPAVCTAVKQLRKQLWSDKLPALWFNPFKFDQDYRRILSPELMALLNRLAPYTTTVWTMDGMITSEPFASCTLASRSQPVTIDDCPFMEAYRAALDRAMDYE